MSRNRPCREHHWPTNDLARGGVCDRCNGPLPEGRTTYCGQECRDLQRAEGAQARRITRRREGDRA
jgi:hypothetical protein